jgi:hypothetical protein
MFKKQIVSFVLILSILTPSFYIPYQVKKAEAFLGFGDTVIDIPEMIGRVINALAMILAQKLIDNLVASTVKWAQNGFEGNPAYVTNPKQFFTNIADGVAGEYIQGTDLGFLCSPFQLNIKLSLTQSYYEPDPFQCTLTEIVGNVEDFYNDFSQGGWDAWFSMTQNSTNNPAGAYLEAKIELDARIAEALELEDKQLDWSQGFMSWSECISEDPLTQECLVRDPNKKTPGGTIKAQLDKVLPSGLDKLITAEHIDQLISGFAAGLLNKYVFGSKGLFASRTRTATASTGSSQATATRSSELDVDSDGIPDGVDGDRDGKLTANNDVCYHGGRPPSCPNSSAVTSSPYFAPVCEAVDEAVDSLTEYTKYIDAHADQIEGGSSLAGQFIGSIVAGPIGAIAFRTFGFGGSADNFKEKSDAEIWSRRTSEVDSSIGRVINTIQGRKAPYFDKMEITLNRFSFYIGRVLESLNQDQDLDLSGGVKFSSGGGGLENLMVNSAKTLRYLSEIKTKIGKCDNPDVTAINSIPVPTSPTAEEGEGTGTNSCPIPTTPKSLCENVDPTVVLGIVNKYKPSNNGITAAIQEINTIYPDAKILEHPVRLDKIDFGGGLIVDIIVGAIGTDPARNGTPDTEGKGWTWNAECPCGGPSTNEESTQPPQQ